MRHCFEAFRRRENCIVFKKVGKRFCCFRFFTRERSSKGLLFTLLLLFFFLFLLLGLFSDFNPT
jgi:hypothetical protein